METGTPLLGSDAFHFGDRNSMTEDGISCALRLKAGAVA
jgi:hypothetical protein